MNHLCNLYSFKRSVEFNTLMNLMYIFSYVLYKCIISNLINHRQWSWCHITKTCKTLVIYGNKPVNGQIGTVVTTFKYLNPSFTQYRSRICACISVVLESKKKLFVGIFLFLNAEPVSVTLLLLFLISNHIVAALHIQIVIWINFDCYCTLKYCFSIIYRVDLTFYAFLASFFNFDSTSVLSVLLLCKHSRKSFSLVLDDIFSTLCC